MSDRLSIIESLETYMPHEQALVDFDTLYPPCRILNVLSMQDIIQLNSIAKDRKLAGKPKEKQNRIKQIMSMRGFKKLAAGTNRLVFKYMEDQSFVIKVPFNAVGLRDNLDELYNQQFLKPFCTKVFEVSPCGTVGMFERVHAISNREEFQLVSSTIFDIIINRFIGQFVLADFGTKFFMNWGIRRHTYPVLLDFPYLYELDGAKLSCNRPDPLSEYGFCGGEIDYDNGFNHLVCKKCGKTYLASELRLSENKKTKSILIEREDIGMIVTILRGDEVVLKRDTTNESNTYRKDKKGRKKETPLEYRERKKCEGFTVSINEESVDGSGDESLIAEQSVQKQNAISDEELNHGYSLNAIPNDINEIYRVTATINNPRKNKKKEDLKDIVDTLKESEEQSYDNPVVTSSQLSTEEVEIAEPISAEMYEMAQQIHEVNSQEDISEEESQPYLQERDLHLTPRDEIDIEESDQNCSTNLSSLLKDVSVEDEEPDSDDNVRPANKELIILSRDEADAISEKCTIAETHKTYDDSVELKEGRVISGGEEPVYTINDTTKIDEDNHIDSSYWD